jgi:hypothetical protein
MLDVLCSGDLGAAGTEPVANVSVEMISHIPAQPHYNPDDNLLAISYSPSPSTVSFADHCLCSGPIWLPIRISFQLQIRPIRRRNPAPIRPSRFCWLLEEGRKGLPMFQNWDTARECRHAELRPMRVEQTASCKWRRSPWVNSFGPATHLFGIIHLLCKFWIKEPHQLLQGDPGVSSPAFIQFRLRVVVSCSNMVIQVIIRGR